ncbi:MAG: type II 3-dehydroquinate dehydratase [candidate division Zixibacteria bacterium]|nr:type II 3-dehydroquinate dehydratase [candidate division Zixibacteria bacterium]
MKKINIINGPNLNLLGKRQPEIYGSMSLSEIDDSIKSLAKKLKLEVSFFQSNSEGAIIDHIQSLEGNTNGVIINPAGLTHTSVALRDSLFCLNIPIVEVHLSNIYAREEFRRKSLIAGVCVGQITGLGADGYKYALETLSRLIT